MFWSYHVLKKEVVRNGKSSKSKYFSSNTFRSQDQSSKLENEVLRLKAEVEELIKTKRYVQEKHNSMCKR